MSAPPRSIGSNVARGLFRGLLVGLALIGTGALRAVLVMISGRSLTGPTVADLRPLGFYVAGFSLAGGVIGAFRPWLHRAPIRYAVFCVAGVLTVTSIVAGGDTTMQWDGLAFMILTPVGAIMGLFGVYVVEHYFPTAGLWHVNPSNRRPNER